MRMMPVGAAAKLEDSGVRAVRLGRGALAATALSLALIAAVGVLGPSAAVVPLPRGLFPIGASLHPSAWLVSSLLAAAVLSAVAATALFWAALGRGWSPSPARLLLAGVVVAGVLAIIPPVGGADVLSYAAYGHAAARGLDPYTVRPSSLGDAFGRAVEDPWRSTPSVYGPLATAEQAVVAKAAGGSLRKAVGLLDLVNAAAFAGAAWLLVALAGDDEARRRRAAVGFGLNPLLLMVVVSGGHVDALAVILVVFALALLRPYPWWSGVAGGAAVAIKLTAGLPLAGWAWLLGRTHGRRGLARAAALAGGAVAAAAAAYAAVGIHAFNQARRASSFVSVGTPWRPIRSALERVIPDHAAGLMVSAGALAVAAFLVVRLARTLPAGDTPAGDAARAGVTVALAWALAAPYVLAWYDTVAWALLVLLPTSRHHRILLAHTGMLALAYLPGRVVVLPPYLAGATTALKSAASPAVLAVLVVGALTAPSRRQAES